MTKKQDQQFELFQKLAEKSGISGESDTFDYVAQYVYSNSTQASEMAIHNLIEEVKKGKDVSPLIGLIYINSINKEKVIEVTLKDLYPLLVDTQNQDKCINAIEALSSQELQRTENKFATLLRSAIAKSQRASSHSENTQKSINDLKEMKDAFNLQQAAIYSENATIASQAIDALKELKSSYNLEIVAMQTTNLEITKQAINALKDLGAMTNLANIVKQSNGEIYIRAMDAFKELEHKHYLERVARHSENTQKSINDLKEIKDAFNLQQAAIYSENATIASQAIDALKELKSTHNLEAVAKHSRTATKIASQAKTALEILEYTNRLEQTATEFKKLQSPISIKQDAKTPSKSENKKKSEHSHRNNI